MSQTKQEQTPEVRATRLRGYELYLATDQDGRRRSMRAISMALGVTVGAVQYWKRKDRWEERVADALQERTSAEGASNMALGALLRQSLFEHVGTLNAMARDKVASAKDRLAAIRELADITIKLKAVDPTDLLADKPKKELPKFKDNLNEPTNDAVEPPDLLLPRSVLGHDDDDSVDGEAGGGPSPEPASTGAWGAGRDGVDAATDP